MPVHVFYCDNCGTREEIHYPIHHPPADFVACRCGGIMHKVWHPPHIGRPFQDGYNPTLGCYVSSRQQLREKLKRRSDEMTRKTGIPHDYKPVDIMDLKPSTPEGIRPEVLKRLERKGIRW